MDLRIDVAKCMYQRVQYIISYAEEPYVCKDSSYEILTRKERIHCFIVIFQIYAFTTGSKMEIWLKYKRYFEAKWEV